MPRRTLRDSVQSVGGAIALALGAYLPWLRTNPALPHDAEIPTILLPGMRAGIDGFDFALLGGAGIVLALRLVGTEQRRQSLFECVTGVGSLFLCVRHLFFYAGVGGDATFVPALGWYVTVLGGVLLAVSGGVRLPEVPWGVSGAVGVIDD